MKRYFKYILCCGVLLSFLPSCKDESEEIVIAIPETDLSILPPDTGGEHIAMPLKPNENIFGHYIYFPSGYSESGPAYPLIVFLHGNGEIGNSETDKIALEKVLTHGPPFLIENARWNPEYPAVVVSPQCHDNWWNAEKIHDHISFLINNYNINENRIYMTGASMGGYGVYSYLETFGAEGHVVAAVPICGGGHPGKAGAIGKIPVWAFHGEDDEKIPPSASIEMVAAINEQNPLFKAKLTIYPEVGHDAWSITYDGTGMGKESAKYDAFDKNIYSWFFGYSKDDSRKVTSNTL